MMMNGGIGGVQSHVQDGPPGKVQCVRPEGAKERPKAPPSKVLIVNVHNMMYPVDIDMLHQIFSKYGIVQKIVTFTKKLNQFQAMVQFDSVDRATDAKDHLDGENIYNECNTLGVSYSTFPELTVRFNNSRSRDYTNPNLPAGSAGAADAQQQRPTLLGGPAYGSVPPQFDANAPYYDPQAAQGYPPASLYPQQSFTVSPAMGVGAGMQGQGPVVFILGIDENTTCDHLFNLFSMYGFVLRAKILHNKNNSAMLQYSDPFYASLACQFLANFPLGSLSVKVQHSTNKEVNAPRGEDPKTKAFMDNMQRFSHNNAQERFSKNACRPSACLHIANLQIGVNEEEVQELFRRCGTVLGFRLLPEKEGAPPAKGEPTRMALINMDSIAEGVLCVATLHNVTVGGRPMKVSFTKQSFEGRPPRDN